MKYIANPTKTKKYLNSSRSKHIYISQYKMGTNFPICYLVQKKVKSMNKITELQTTSF